MEELQQPMSSYVKDVRNLIRQIHFKAYRFAGGVIPFSGGYVEITKDRIRVCLTLRVGKWQFPAPVLEYDRINDFVVLAKFSPPPDLEDALQEAIQQPFFYKIEGAKFERTSVNAHDFKVKADSICGELECRFSLFDEWFVFPTYPLFVGIVRQLREVLGDGGSDDE